MPVARLDAVELAPREVRATAILGATYLDTLHAAGCADLANCDEVPVQPTYMHHQKIYPAELRAIAEVGLTRTLGVELQFPFRVVGTTIQYTTPDGQPYVPADPGVHHRDETLAGIGDPWLLGRWGARLGDFLLVLRAGVSLPLGRTQPNPFLLGDVGIRHQHIQFGTGTFDPVAGFQLARPIGSVQLAAYAQGQASLYQNTHGFRAPARFFGGVQGSHRLFGTLDRRPGRRSAVRGRRALGRRHPAGRQPGADRDPGRRRAGAIVRGDVGDPEPPRPDVPAHRHRRRAGGLAVVARDAERDRQPVVRRSLARAQRLTTAAVRLPPRARAPAPRGVAPKREA